MWLAIKPCPDVVRKRGADALYNLPSASLNFLLHIHRLYEKQPCIQDDSRPADFSIARFDMGAAWEHYLSLFAEYMRQHPGKSILTMDIHQFEQMEDGIPQHIQLANCHKEQWTQIHRSFRSCWYHPCGTKSILENCSDAFMVELHEVMKQAPLVYRQLESAVLLIVYEDIPAGFPICKDRLFLISLKELVRGGALQSVAQKLLQ